MAGSLTSTNTVFSLFGKHLHKVAEKTLFLTPVLYEFADKHPLPGKSGTTMFIPRSIQKDQVIALTEGTPIGPSATSAHYYSGTVAGYGAAKRYSDFLVDVHEIPAMISNDIEGMTKYAGYKIDSLILGAISAGGTYVAPDGATATGSVVDTTPLKQRFLFDASTTLDSVGSPYYGDGLYWGAFHPRTVHDLYVNTSSGATQLFSTSNFLTETDYGAQKLERMGATVLGNVRIWKSNHSGKGVFAAGGMSAGNSGHMSFVMAPGAVAAVDLATSRLRTYMKPLGSAGADDPIDQKMTAGVKFYFTAIAMDTANRLVKTASGKTL